ncbi:hypothetical protein [Flavobacterium sp.]|uniref:hypothetical protein n=1 Tax=Flavobacterium sp. TaxID=239 RepID=UPI00286AB2D2|nr:hypothetical protein [Flavobacterium sp.]
MTFQNRFQDENLLVSNFYKEVLVVCPSCSKKAMATVDFDACEAKLICTHCSCIKKSTTKFRKDGSIQTAAHSYFDAELWLLASFKNGIFFAYNDKHLEYLERYIAATLREHKDRTGFTILEKLPKFYHEAKNRESLLKIIAKLKTKK